MLINGDKPISTHPYLNRWLMVRMNCAQILGPGRNFSKKKTIKSKNHLFSFPMVSSRVSPVGITRTLSLSNPQIHIHYSLVTTINCDQLSSLYLLLKSRVYALSYSRKIAFLFYFRFLE